MRIYVYTFYPYFYSFLYFVWVFLIRQNVFFILGVDWPISPIIIVCIYKWQIGTNGSSSLLYLLCDIPKSRCTTLFLFCITNSTFKGYLGCLHFFAIVDCAVVNIGMQATFSYSDFNSWGYVPRSGILNHVADRFPLGKALSILISIVAGQGTLPTNVEQVCLFPHSYERWY